jgi:hypothetical protein
VTVNGIPSFGTMFVIPAVVSTVAPQSGAAGTQVTITGTGFGASQGTSMAWLGSTKANVVSWSDTVVVATVAPGSTTGTAQVQRSGVWSNSTPFTVASPTISTVAPLSGIVGTSVTINGSGFGASQGTGQVWIGTAQGVVQSWSATQIVAQVAAGSKSGVVQVLNNGTASGTVAFTVNSLNLVSVSPDTAGAGSTVTFSGIGFGATQGSGQVRLGSAAGTVVSWSDTAITATVASGSISGVARVQVSNGELSNALAFKVTGGPSGPVSMIAPSMLNMLVGDSRSLQAVSSTGQTVTGLTWSSSNTAVVSLSTDDPPVLSALAPGRVTISAGGASADVVVMAGDQFPVGTTAWSTPVGVGEIVPAVPSSTGVADVFVVSPQAVSALTSEGAVAWRATLPAQSWKRLADFQGGMIVLSGGKTITRLNGMTGASTLVYSAGNADILDMAIHQDGTVFATTQAPGGPNNSTLTSLVGIDSATGGLKFSVPVDTSATGSGFLLRSPMIAGDGYAYLPYATRTDCGGGSPTNRLFLLRVSSSGVSSSILVTTWTSTCSDVVPVSVAPLITNGDTGALMSFETNTDAHFGLGTISFYLATTNGLGVSLSSAPVLPGQEGPVEPRLQAEDGSFVGVASVPGGDRFMVAFGATGGMRWAVRGQSPLMALADGGVISESGVNYSPVGSVISRESLLRRSWRGNVYPMAASQTVDSGIAQRIIEFAKTLAAQVGNNPSGNRTAARTRYFRIQFITNFDFKVQDRPELTTSIANQARLIMHEAKIALQKAYQAFPVDVDLLDATSTWRPDQLVKVVDIIPVPGRAAECGLSDPLTGKRWTGFEVNMLETQRALGMNITTVAQRNLALQRTDLYRTIGRSNGHIAAHEIAHGYMPLAQPPMDDDPRTVPSARGGYNATGCTIEIDPSPWLGYWPGPPRIELHWPDLARKYLYRCLSRSPEQTPPQCYFRALPGEP